MKSSAFFPFVVLVAFQLLGEAVVRVAGLPFPGMVLGAVLLFVALFLHPPLHARIAAGSHLLIRSMLLFFVPASVGMMTLTKELEQYGLILAVVIVVSTWATALVSAVVFELVRKRLP